MKDFSTIHLDGFYEIDFLHRTMEKAAILNIILCDEDWLRYHRFTKEWTKGVVLAEVDNGSGDRMLIFFTEKGCLIKGFDHESPLSPHAQEEYKVWDGIYEGLPGHFEELLEDPAVEKEEVTFCIWRERDDTEWSKGTAVYPKEQDDGSGYLLGTIPADSEAFKEWSDDYFDSDLPPERLFAVFAGEKITEEVIAALNPHRNAKEAMVELRNSGLL